MMISGRRGQYGLAGGHSGAQYTFGHARRPQSEVRHPLLQVAETEHRSLTALRSSHRSLPSRLWHRARSRVFQQAPNGARTLGRVFNPAIGLGGRHQSGVAVAQLVEQLIRNQQVSGWLPPVAGPVAVRVAVRGVNLEGDEQADRAAHGGSDKAVYSDTLEDKRWWESEIGRTTPPIHRKPPINRRFPATRSRWGHSNRTARFWRIPVTMDASYEWGGSGRPNLDSVEVIQEASR
jgi:hypothetical protein